MRERLGLLLIILCVAAFAGAQVDSILYDPVQKIPDGVYLSHADLRKNKSIDKSQIVSRFEKDQLEFLGKVMYEEKFSFRVGDSVYTLPTRDAWGYVQNNTFYVNYKGDFYRIPVFGAISYLVANVKVVYTGVYDPRFGYMGGGTGTEIREFLLNYYDGSMTEYSPEYFESLLASDQALLAEYLKISKRKRKDQLYMFVRKFNLAHPVYFLK